jgi:hypothetical protein
MAEGLSDGAAPEDGALGSGDGGVGVIAGGTDPPGCADREGGGPSGSDACGVLLPTVPKTTTAPSAMSTAASAVTGASSRQWAERSRSRQVTARPR